MHTTGQPERRDAGPQLVGVALAGAVDAAGDHAVHGGMLAQPAERFDDDALALPLLNVAGDADARSVGRDIELAPHLGGRTLRPQPRLVHRVVDDARVRRLEAVGAAVIEHGVASCRLRW